MELLDDMSSRELADVMIAANDLKLEPLVKMAQQFLQAQLELEAGWD